MPRFFRFLTSYLLLAVLLLASCTKKTDPEPQLGAISGQVAPAAAVTTVTATGTDGRTATATPNAAGSYQLTGLAAGSYVLSFAAAPGYQAPASVTVVVAAGTVTQVPPVTAAASTGSISGQVSPANALTGVTATDAAGRSSAASVGAGGSFVLSGLAPGTYTVSFAAAAGFQAPANVQVVVAGGQTAVVPPITIAVQTRAGLLVGRNWRIVAYTSTGSGGVTDIFASFGACQRDNFFRFNQPNVFVEDEGPTKCAAADPQVNTGTWALGSNDTAVTISLPRGVPDTYSIVALSVTVMQWRRVGGGGGSDIENITFAAF